MALSAAHPTGQTPLSSTAISSPPPPSKDGKEPTAFQKAALAADIGLEPDPNEDLVVPARPGQSGIRPSPAAARSGIVPPSQSTVSPTPPQASSSSAVSRPSASTVGPTSATTPTQPARSQVRPSPPAAAPVDPPAPPPPAARPDPLPHPRSTMIFPTHLCPLLKAWCAEGREEASISTGPS